MATTSESSLFWFVMSYYIAQAANVLLLVKITKQKNVFGVSIDSQIALLIATFARTVWFSDTKLPTMYSAYAEIIIAICLHSYIVYLCFKHKDSLQYELPVYLRWYTVVGVACILSCFMFPGKMGRYFITQQMFVSVTSFTEALSLLP